MDDDIDVIHMLPWDDFVLEPIVLDEIYKVDRVTLGLQTRAPYRLTPDITHVQLSALNLEACPHCTTQSPFILTSSED